MTVDDLAANGLLGEAHPQTCWERSAETLTARKDEIAGLAVASAERIEACILYRRAAEPAGDRPEEPRQSAPSAEIVLLRSFVDEDGTRLTQLLSRLGPGTFRFPKVHPVEISTERLDALGFRAAAGHRLYAMKPHAG